jgi:hypothetical protein
MKNTIISTLNLIKVAEETTINTIKTLISSYGEKGVELADHSLDATFSVTCETNPYNFKVVRKLRVYNDVLQMKCVNSGDWELCRSITDWQFLLEEVANALEIDGVWR